MQTLRKHLRAATSAQHERVDAAYSAFDLGQRSGYRAFLSAHAQILLPLEAELERSGIESMLDDWSQRRRGTALLCDLADMDGTPPAPLLEHASKPAGWCWGAAYVLEGSRLGGRVLAKRVGDADPSAPLRYLTHSSESPLWLRFLEKLEEQGPAYPWSDLLAGANDTFVRFLEAAQTHRPQRP